MGKGPKDWESAKEAVVSLEDCLENRVGDWMDGWNSWALGSGGLVFRRWGDW